MLYTIYFMDVYVCQCSICLLYTSIYGLYVLKEYQNKKIGYELIKSAIHLLSKYNYISLWVLKGNIKAINFYKKVGFILTGEEKKAVLGNEIIELKMIYKQTSFDLG